MLIYEVNLEIDTDIRAEFSAWLKEHVDEILRIDGFVKADIYKNAPDAFTVHYFLRDQHALDHYLAHHAAEMRQKGLQKFPGKFKANRRILEPLLPR